MADVIELGDVRTVEHEATRRRLPPGRLRSIVVMALVVICIASLTAAQPFERSWTRPLWTQESVRVSAFTLSSRNLIAVNDRTVVAYDVQTGAERWRITFDLVPIYAIDVGFDMVAVLLHPVTATGEDAPQVAFVEETTGLVRSRGIGGLVGVTPSGEAVLSTAWAGARCESADWCADVTGIDVRSGDVRWRIPATGGIITTLTSPGDTRWFALSLADGGVELYDAATGRPQERLRPRTRRGVELERSGRWLTRDALVDLTVDGSGSRLVAYHLPSMRLHWTLDLPGADETGLRNDRYLDECGPNLCLGTGRQTFVIDPATGRLAATVAMEIIGVLGDGGLLAWTPTDMPGEGQRRDIFLVGVDTGGTLATFTGASLVAWSGSAGRALLMRQGDNATGFTLLDERGIARELPAVAAPSAYCEARVEVLACEDPSGHVRVWRLPP